jgi:hypothetical protein
LAVCCHCRRTALHAASAQGHTATAKVLVWAGADVHCQNSEGYGRGLRRGAFLWLHRGVTCSCRMVRCGRMPAVQEDGAAPRLRERPHGDGDGAGGFGRGRARQGQVRVRSAAASWATDAAFDSDGAMGAHVGRAGGRRCTMPQDKARRRR